MRTTRLFLDLGMVTVRLDMQRCIRAFEQLGVKDVGKQISNSRQYGLFSAIELGTMTNADFFDEMRRQHAITATDEQIADAWNAFILDTPVELQQLIKQVRAKMKTYILSNTNQLHYDYWHDVCMGGEGGATVEECFDKVYLSNELHLAKPDAEIYQAILADCGAKPEECLYLDDNAANVAAAKSLGWDAHVCANPEETIERLKMLLYNVK